MKILIVAATPEEIPFPLKTTNTYDHLFDVVITGVGMVATALSLGRALSHQTYYGILNLGIAGSFRREIPLGTVVRIQQDTLSEFGVEDNEHFCSVETIGLAQSQFQERLFLEDMTLISTLKQVRGITVNTVHGNDASIQTIQARLDPDVESMEGAAVFHAAWAYELPCLQIRAISNFIERRDRNKWQIEHALENLNSWFSQFLKSYSPKTP